MDTDTNKSIPIWGWPILITLLYGSGLLLSYMGSDFIIAYAHWGDSIYWAFFAAAALAFSLWSAQVQSEKLTLIIAVLFFIFISVNTQINYYSKSKFELYTIVQQSEDNEWPTEYKSQDRDTLYQSYINQRINPTGLSWLDHLRLEADIGIIRTEQQGHRKYGGRKGVEVYRQGFWMWWGWFICYLFLAIGCFFGMAGSAFVGKKEDNKNKVAEIIVNRMNHVLKDKGLNDDEIKSIITKPRTYYSEISDEEVLELLPIADKSTVNEIIHDLKLSKEWYRNSKLERKVEQNDFDRVNALVKKYYNRPIDDKDKLYSYHLLLLAADKLHRATENKSFYDCLLNITDISDLLFIPNNIQPFHVLDLENIEYKTLKVGDIWEPLYTGRQHFYSYNSSWELLEGNKPEDIPEDAYLAIIYQYCHQPAPRGYEMWSGTTPSELIEILSPKLRDAVLTYITKMIKRSSITSSNLSTLQRLTACASDWPQEQAEELLHRCIQSGWRYSLDRLPETPSWRKFIDENDKTPFGDLSNIIKWY
jgi:hypothetical protein